MKNEQLVFNQALVRWRFGLVLLALFLFLPTLIAQIEKDKVIEKEFDLGDNGIVKIDHRYGLLKVVKSSNNKVKVSARMRMEGSDEEDIQKALDQFDLNLNELGSQLTVETDLNIKNWQGWNNRITLTFKDGTKVKGLKKFKAEMLVAIPDLKSLMLKNKYEDIIIDHNLNGDLEINLYDGDLEGHNIGGNFEMEIKYGKAVVGNTQNADITLYDSKMELGDAKTVKLRSKYSKYSVGTTEELTIKAYDDKMELGNVKGQLSIEDKYSDIQLANFSNARLDIYDANITGKEGKMIDIDGSKYSKYRFEQVGSLDIDRSYDDEFVIEDLENLDVAASKYSEFIMDKLSGKLELYSSYDDKVAVQTIQASFKGLKLDGKYTKVNLDIPFEVKYQLDINTTHGSVTFPEAAFESQYYKEKGSTLEVRGKMKGATNDSPKVLVKGYDCKIVLE